MDITVDTEGTNRVKPTPLIFMSINIEGNRHHLPHLYIEVLHSLYTEDLKTNFLGVLFLCFQHIGSYFPLCTRTRTRTRALRQYGNDSSCYVHKYNLIIFSLKS